MGDCPREASIRMLMMPRDTNHRGTIFGGVILSHIDQAGAIGAMNTGCDQVVTVAMDKVVFKAPVMVGDLVSYYTELVKKGRTSVTVRVEVEAERRFGNHEIVEVTAAELTFVNVDDNGKPAAIAG